ncbi:MAG TPA: FMN-binding protein [Firmicutes bacterium]|nr:FMN-binding protein [Bacillota bacterium]
MDLTQVVVIQRVLQQQALDVDTVSGATSSSKTILKAIENALRP